MSLASGRIYLSLLLIGLMIISMVTLMPSNNVWAQGGEEKIDNGYIEITFDLDHGGAIANIRGICSDLLRYPVGQKGVSGQRGGMGDLGALTTVMWDLISDNNPWYGKAVTTPAQAQIVEKTDNYTVIQITYTITEDPFNGLQVIKTFKLYKNSFIADFNVTLKNTGAQTITIDLSEQWGRPIGYGIEIVGLLGQKPDEDTQFLVYTDGSFEAYVQGSSWSGGLPGGPVNVDGKLLAIGLLDNSTDPSPWGWITMLIMADQDTISKTSYAWLETGPGGKPATLIRPEFKPLTLDPGASEEYHMKLYSGPIHPYFMKDLGLPNNFIEAISRGVSKKVPCIKVSYELKYPINLKLNTLKGEGIPDTVIYFYDAITGELYTQVSLTSTQMQVKLPFEKGTYKVILSDIEGLTTDKLGKFRFIDWILPNGTKVEDSTVIVELNKGDTLTLEFTITYIAMLKLVFVGSDLQAILDPQAGNITYSLTGPGGKVIKRGISVGYVAGASSTNIREIDLGEVEVPGTYTLIVSAKSTGGFSLSKAIVNGKEVSFNVQGDYAYIPLNLNDKGNYTIKLSYSPGLTSGGGGVSLIVWIGVIIALVIFIVALILLKKKK